MCEKVYLLLLLFLLGPVASLPLSPSSQISVFDSEHDVKDGEEPQYIFSRILEANKGDIMNLLEGDILLTNERNAISCPQCLWPKSQDGLVRVPYAFGSNYSDPELDLFKNSMAEFESLTCVRFLPRTTEVDYLNIVSSDGCVSYLGRIGREQKVGLDRDGCMARGVIQHELNHALGFYHEHMRSDRDNYVRIMYKYIPQEFVPQFAKLDTNNLGVEYDYESTMHYDKFAFTNTSGKPTIVPKPNPNRQIGQIYGLSGLDVSKINKLYECDVCGNLLNVNNGIVSSTNYPSPYPHNSNCAWLIRAQSDQVSLNFDAFDIQSSPKCVSDYVKIYDGPSKNYPMLMDKTCGNKVIPPIIASSQQVLVEFSSDSSVAGVGFRIFYSTVECGGTFITPQRSFTSPGYPSPYVGNLNCVYTITAPVGKKISLSFSDFQTQGGYSCPRDFLEIMDGSTLRGRFCGEKKIPDIISVTNYMKLTFGSDESLWMRGFNASYTFI